MLSRFLFIACLLLFSFINAQSDWSEWKKGTIFLSSGDSIKGNVIYEDGVEIVQYMDDKNSSVKSFGAFVVDSFYYYSGDIKKKFRRYYWNKNRDHYTEVPIFFQTIYQSNAFGILAKENRVTVIDDWGDDFMSPVSFSATAFPTYSEKVDYDYYFYSQDKKISFIYDLKKFLIERYPAQKKQIKKKFNSYDHRNMFRKINELLTELEED